MKKLIIFGIIMMMGLMVTQPARSQEPITYISNLGQLVSGSEAVGSDSYAAAWVFTGNNPGGYALDSVQLGMAPASGEPNDFTAMLYSAVPGFTAFLPGSKLGTLSGSADPMNSAIYTYTASGLTLSPSTAYFIVLNAGTPVANGAYEWSLNNAPYSFTGGWQPGGYLVNSSDGSSWNATFTDPQFAVTATAVPEPDTLVLLGLPGLLFLGWRRHREKSKKDSAL